MTSTYRSCPGLHVELVESVLTLRIDRPEKRNSLTDEMLMAMIEALTAAGQDESVRALLLCGAGEHFCAGFDIVARNQGGGGRPRVGSIQRRLPSHAHRLIPLLMTVQVPVVAAIRGYACGLGLHLVLAADFAVVADGARLWEPFAERGFTPDSGGTWLLPRRIGEARAREVLILGRPVSGTEAAEWGMVHRAVPDGDLDAEASRLVAQLAAGPTVALGLTKSLLAKDAVAALGVHLDQEAMALELSSRSEDFREGLTAFREKRPPRFSGR